MAFVDGVIRGWTLSRESRQERDGSTHRARGALVCAPLRVLSAVTVVRAAMLCLGWTDQDSQARAASGLNRNNSCTERSVERNSSGMLRHPRLLNIDASRRTTLWNRPTFREHPSTSGRNRSAVRSHRPQRTHWMGLHTSPAGVRTAKRAIKLRARRARSQSVGRSRIGATTMTATALVSEPWHVPRVWRNSGCTDDRTSPDSSPLCGNSPRPSCPRKALRPIPGPLES
jgi:hypothetical protein